MVYGSCFLREIPKHLRQIKVPHMAKFSHTFLYSQKSHTLAAGAAESQGRVVLVLDLDERIQDHGSAIAHVHLIRLHPWLIAGNLGILSTAWRGGGGGDCTV